MLLPLGQAPLPPSVSASCHVPRGWAYRDLHRIITEQDSFWSQGSSSSTLISVQYLILTSSRRPGIFISCKLQLRIILYVCVVCSWRKWGKSVVCLLLCPGTRSPNFLRGPAHTRRVCLKQRRLKLRWKPNVRVMRPFVSVHQYMKAHLAVSDLWLVDWVYICMVIDCCLNIRSCAAIDKDLAEIGDYY